ncbi:MAG: hypothetical protein ABSG71_03335 [Thermodesulfobacteriota bacterium]|jgi:tRNA nucleotidyltransferase/poly(A) polymerase
MKFLAGEKESEKLFKKLQEIMAEEVVIKEEQKKLEPSMRRTFQRFVLANACLNSSEASEARFAGEALRAKKVNLWDAWYRRLTKIQIDLQKITAPAIVDFCEVLLKELKNLNKGKVFRIITDKENLHAERGGRIFEAQHNFFSIHEAQQKLLSAVEALRGMDLQPISSIKKVFEEAIQKIPSEFEVATTLGNSEFRSWILDNQPRDLNPDESQGIWLQTAQYLSDLEKKVLDFKKVKDEEFVGGLVSKHRDPII